MATNEADKQFFDKISARAFEHPLDRTALGALQKVPGLDWVVRKFVSMVGERRLHLLFLASAVRVNERQFPKIHASFDEACRILDIDERPELFVSHHFVVNAAALGVDKPFIIVTSPIVEMMSETELQCVLGHELGHVMCGHALYTTTLLLLLRLWFLFMGVPGGIYAVLAISMALLEWSRKAELTADRAGLLVSQDPELSYRVDMKLAGGGQSDQMNVEEFHRQAQEYESGGDLLDGVLKLALLVGQTHPFPVLRVAELRRWVESGEYEKILAGDYPRRGDQDGYSWLENIKATAADYKDSFGSSEDPLVSTLRDLGSGATATGSELVDLFKRAIGLDASGRGGSDDDTEP